MHVMLLNKMSLP